MPPVVDAQPASRVRIAILTLGGVSERPTFKAFVQRLGELGYVEGRNLTIDVRNAEFKEDRLPDLAQELIRVRPDVILAATTALPALAAMKATAAIPIVFVIAGDPIRAKIVASLARPGGNITGVTSLNADLDAKRVELVTELAPGIRRVALLVSAVDPDTPARVAAVESAARVRGVQLHRIQIRDLARLEGAVEEAKTAGAGALLVLGSPEFYPRQPALARLAAKHRLPVVSPWRELPEGGGLASYGTDAIELFVRAAGMVDRILKGARPGELPVEQPTKFELIINARAARELGLTVPPAMLVRAERVIE